MSILWAAICCIFIVGDSQEPVDKKITASILVRYSALGQFGLVGVRHINQGTTISEFYLRYSSVLTAAIFNRNGTRVVWTRLSCLVMSLFFREPHNCMIVCSTIRNAQCTLINNMSAIFGKKKGYTALNLIFIDSSFGNVQNRETVRILFHNFQKIAMKVMCIDRIDICGEAKVMWKKKCTACFSFSIGERSERLYGQHFDEMRTFRGHRLHRDETSMLDIHKTMHMGLLSTGEMC